MSSRFELPTNYPNLPAAPDHPQCEEFVSRIKQVESAYMDDPRRLCKELQLLKDDAHQTMKRTKNRNDHYSSGLQVIESNSKKTTASLKRDFDIAKQQLEEKQEREAKAFIRKQEAETLQLEDERQEALDASDRDTSQGIEDLQEEFDVDSDEDVGKTLENTRWAFRWIEGVLNQAQVLKLAHQNRVFSQSYDATSKIYATPFKSTKHNAASASRKKQVTPRVRSMAIGSTRSVTDGSTRGLRAARSLASPAPTPVSRFNRLALDTAASDPKTVIDVQPSPSATATTTFEFDDDESLDLEEIDLSGSASTAFLLRVMQQWCSDECELPTLDDDGKIFAEMLRCLGKEELAELCEFLQQHGINENDEVIRRMETLKTTGEWKTHHLEAKFTPFATKTNKKCALLKHVRARIALLTGMPFYLPEFAKSIDFLGRRKGKIPPIIDELIALKIKLDRAAKKKADIAAKKNARKSKR